MLQQTQVSTVIPYYHRFIERFPDIKSLANASQEEVMPYWAGLGYYARARNLHKCAQTIMQKYQGHFPSNPELLEQLPGIGKSTANAIAAFCFGTNTPIMDGNVKRVFSRFYGIEGYGSSVDKRLWKLAYDNVQGETDIGIYNQGLMDLGSMVCTRTKPLCEQCPLHMDCYAKQHNQQAYLPSKKPKKIIPQHETFMLVVLYKNHILLQQRPQQGIWGGLLSLPELPSQQAVEIWLSEHTSLSAQKMISFEHVFSHYRLLIHPILINIGTNDNTLKEERLFANAQWFNRYEQLALPSPVAKIISGLNDSYTEGLWGV